MHDGPAPVQPDPAPAPVARQRRQWGEPAAPVPAPAPVSSGRHPTKENRDPAAPVPGPEPPAVPALSGRLMPWEQEMLVKRAQEEAVAMGLPPTPSKEVIARAFGDSADDADPDVWGPPPPKPKPAVPPKKRSSAAATASARATRPTGNDAVPASAATRAAIAAAGSEDRTSASASALRPASARPNAPGPTSGRRKSPYAAAAVPGFVAAHARQTVTAAIQPVAKAAAAKAPASPAKASTPAVTRAAEAASAEIFKSLTPPAPAPAPPPARAPAADADLFPVHVAPRAEATDAGEEVAMLLGAFAQRAAAVTRGEASPFELTAASPEERDAPARTRDSNEDTKDTVVETSAAEEATTNAGEEATIHARANVASESEATVSAGDARASAKRSGTASSALERAMGASRRSAHAPAGAKATSKKSRIPTEMVAKIVEKAAEKQRELASPGGSPGAGAATETRRTTPRQKHARSPKPAASRAENPPSPTARAPAPEAIDFDAFLKLQEAEPRGKSPKKSGGKAAFSGASISDADPVAAAAAAKRVAAAKAPKRPTAASTTPVVEDVVVVKKSKDAGDKVTRQMFDKRESRRMNAKPFSAAVRRWRNRRVAAGGARKLTPKSGGGSRPGSPPGGVRVFVRKRPLFEHERARGEFDCVTVPAPPAPLSAGDATEVVVHNCQMHADLKRMFVKHSAFDVTRAFGENAGSEEVYETAAAPMVEGALSGRVGALFMYGQTGSGKTHTMEAIEKAATSALFRGVAGIVPGAASVRVAYFEIAGKKCTDLLSPTRTEIALKEVGGGAVGAGAGAAMDPSEYRKLDVQLVGAVEPEVRTAEELEAIIQAGKSRRAVSATHCNAASSRSHAVLRLTCVLDRGPAAGEVGRLTLVDCAGSERKEDNMHHSAEQRRETAEINASLYALKECVRMRKMQHQRFGVNGNGEGTGGGHVHVPYRSSHLTRVLMECFVRPDAQLGVIGTVSPASTDTEHSVSTLKTVGLIGGGEDGDGVSEEKEDVSKNLSVGEDGTVVEATAERVVAPVRWSNAHIKAWLAKPENEKIAGKITVPSTLVGRDIVRMSAMALQKICGGDKKLAEVLHTKIRDEIARCSSRSR